MALAALAGWCGILLLAGCESPTSSTMPELPAFGGPVVSTQSGRISIYAHEYGEVLPWHLATAERSWIEASSCLGLSVHAIRAFPVALLDGSPPCGLDGKAGCVSGDHRYMEIIGGSWDFDPHHPERSPGPEAEIQRLWRHEWIHVGLGVRDGDIDPEHRSDEWRCEN